MLLIIFTFNYISLIEAIFLFDMILCVYLINSQLDDLISTYHIYTNIHYLRSRSYCIVKNMVDRLISTKYVDENTVYI